jgi:hypothetical protein
MVVQLHGLEIRAFCDLSSELQFSSSCELVDRSDFGSEQLFFPDFIAFVGSRN